MPSDSGLRAFSMPHRQRRLIGMNPQRILIHATAIADGTGLFAAPGTVLIEGDRIVAAGRPEQIGEVAGVRIESRLDCVIIPAFVNAHTHLDLTHIGPVAFDGNFTRWVDRVRGERARSPEGIAESVREGVRVSRAGGTALVGDIAGVRSTVPTRTLREGDGNPMLGLGGVSFLEVFGVGRSQAAAIEVMRATVESIAPLEHGVRFGLQPHAPYSCGPDVYRAAADLAKGGLPVATHLAETLEELAFVDRADGALAEMLKRLGVWDDTIRGFGVHAIDHLAQLWSSTPFIAAHVNYAADRHLDVLSHLPITVAYCPRASTYFGHGQGDAETQKRRDEVAGGVAPYRVSPSLRLAVSSSGHRYREMLSAGINVALGTDSILCLDTPARISVLDEMRLLFRRDAVDPLTLLRMATTNGAKALGACESLFTMTPGRSAGLLSIRVGASDRLDALTRAMLNDEPPKWLLGPFVTRDDWFEPS